MRRLDRRTLLLAGASAAVGVLLTRGRDATTQPASPVASPGPSPWVADAPITVARSELAAAVIDDIVYVCGGFGGGQLVHAFDPASRTWSPAPDMPYDAHHLGVAALGGRVFVAGGYTANEWTAVDRAFAWDPAGSTGWEAINPLPSARGAFAMAVIGDALYAAGGAFEQLGGPICAELLRYDATADRWEQLAPLPTPREHLAVASDGARLYAIGGRAEGSERDELAGANEVYDPATDSWSAATPLPVPRGGLSGVFIGAGIAVLGGERGDDLFADVNLYDPAADAWTALPSMPTARHGLASAVVNGQLYAITGSTLAGRIENTPVVERLALGAPAATPTA